MLCFALISYNLRMLVAGAQFGTVVGMPISGFLCDKFGWESVFYVFGENFPPFCSTAHIFDYVDFVLLSRAIDPLTPTPLRSWLGYSRGTARRSISVDISLIAA